MVRLLGEGAAGVVVSEGGRLPVGGEGTVVRL